MYTNDDNLDRMVRQERNPQFRGGILAYVFVILATTIFHEHRHCSIETIWVLVRSTCYCRPREKAAADTQIGKTVQMIATMVYNLPTDEDRSKTTLIVVPAALLLQVQY